MFYKIKAWLRHYFGFTAKESRGFLALSGLVLLVLMTPSFYSWFAPTTPPIEFTITELKLDSAMSVLEQKPTLGGPSGNAFAFDPNVANEEELKELGFASFLAKRIVNYRSKGGKFKTKTDLLRIYGMPTDLYERLSSYIQLPDSLIKSVKGYASHSASTASKSSFPRFTSLDINIADTSEWKKINGIGSVLAARIVKFRDKLGGFAHKEQLWEVYGLDSTVVKSNWEKMTLVTSHKQLNVNKANEPELATHPYVGKKVAKVLVNYRAQHGDFKKAEDLLEIKVLEKEKWEKLRPYLTF